MIQRFGDDTALLLIDVQVGVNVAEYWGGAQGRRNNPAAEANLIGLLDAWRSAGRTVAFTRHDSREAESPLKLHLATGAQLPGLEIADSEISVSKDVNSGFIGTPLEVELRRAGARRLVIAGFFTNMCVETTTRMAGNLGFDTYLIPEACAASNRTGPDGVDHDPELIHDLSVANLHGEFCTAIGFDAATGLLAEDRSDLERAQGNE